MRRGGRLVAAVTLSISSSLALSWFATRPALAAAGNDDDQGAEVWLTESENGVSPAAENAGTLPLVHWRSMFTPHFRIHFYPEERAFADRAAISPSARYRLITATSTGSRAGASTHAHRSDRRRQRRRQLGAVQLHLRLRRAARRAGRALRLRRLRQAADHPRVHARRAPGHDPAGARALVNFAAAARSTRPTCRSRPGSSRGWRC